MISWNQTCCCVIGLPECGNSPEGRQAHFSQVGFGANKESVAERKISRSKDELRELWRTAIKQQILLQRMEKENLKLKGETKGRSWTRTRTQLSMHVFLFVVSQLHDDLFLQCTKFILLASKQVCYCY